MCTNAFTFFEVTDHNSDLRPLEKQFTHSSNRQLVDVSLLALAAGGLAGECVCCKVLATLFKKHTHTHTHARADVLAV